MLKTSRHSFFSAPGDLITGDFNLHHDLWATDNYSSLSEAEDLVGWMGSRGFSLLNYKGTIERASRTHVVNLTWANDEVFAMPLVSGWSVRHELAIGPDHLPVTWFTPSDDPPISPMELARAFKFDDKRFEGWSSRFPELIGSSFSSDLLYTEEVTPSSLHPRSPPSRISSSKRRRSI
jgi:hypothetical protein